jgi:hypothetical protein
VVIFPPFSFTTFTGYAPGPGKLGTAFGFKKGTEIFSLLLLPILIEELFLEMFSHVL